MTADDLKMALQTHARVDDAVFLQRFFKTAPGQYGAGDEFIGVRVPMLRKVCHEFRDLQLAEIQKLFDSPIHEHRLSAVVLLADGYRRAKTGEQKQAIYDVYLKNTMRGRINNWDLVDVSAPKVVGAHLHGRDKTVLMELARSESVWCRRVAMLAIFYDIQRGDPVAALKVIDLVLHDSHDLMHKAVGWMLREIGKRCGREVLLQFLDERARDMPRTSLRYAIEHLPPAQKQHYMQLKTVPK